MFRGDEDLMRHLWLGLVLCAAFVVGCSGQPTAATKDTNGGGDKAGAKDAAKDKGGDTKGASAKGPGPKPPPLPPPPP